MERPPEKRRHDEARALAGIGSVLAQAELPPVEVRLPLELAEQAIAAWRRDDAGQTEDETPNQRRDRDRAGALALIGLAIEHRGRWDDGTVVVELSPELIGLAITASDDPALD